MKKGVKLFGKKARLGAEIVAVGALTGLFAGVVITCFVALCSLAERFARNDFYGFFRRNPAFIPLLFLALFAGSVLIGGIMRFMSSVRGSGIPQTEGATRGLFRFKWYEAVTGMFAAALYDLYGGQRGERRTIHYDRRRVRFVHKRFTQKKRYRKAVSGHKRGLRGDFRCVQRAAHGYGVRL